VFDDDGDRQVYLRWLCKYKEQHAVRIWAWCLMENHVHLVCVPETETGLAEMLRSAHMRYANYLNRKRGALGHLWQGRFYSCVLDDEHLWAAIRYVEANPVRGGLAKRAEDHPWSSARARVRGKPDGVLDEGLPVDGVIGDASNWARWLEAPISADVVKALRANTRTGRPMGSEAFVAKIEALLGRRLRALPRGRPKTRGK
jgi:putative transposase